MTKGVYRSTDDGRLRLDAEERQQFTIKLPRPEAAALIRLADDLNLAYNATVARLLAADWARRGKDIGTDVMFDPSEWARLCGDGRTRFKGEEREAFTIKLPPREALAFVHLAKSLGIPYNATVVRLLDEDWVRRGRNIRTDPMFVWPLIRNV